MDRQLFERIYETVARREPTYDGVYYTGVRTTKIVCRPSCRAKTPKPENVTFYASLAAAVRAGYRPCKRCKPDEHGQLRPDAALAAQADAVIERRCRDKLTLRAIAEELAVSPFHLQRVYSGVRGYSPAEQLQRVRLREAERLLRETDMPVAEIAHRVGYASPSHFAAWFGRRAGRAPTEYRTMGEGGDGG